jgi:splicing factor 3A subunit 3
MGEVESAMKPVEEEFEKDWTDGKVDGWQKQANGADPKSNGSLGEGIWCAACKSPLRCDTHSVGLITYRQRVPGQKHYAKQTVYDAHLTSKKHVKAAERLSSEGGSANAPPPAPAPVTEATTLLC